MIKKRWIVGKTSSEATKLGSTYNLNPILIQLLLNRGVPKEEFFSFLDPSPSSLHPWQLLPDIEKACARIKKAIRGRENIFLFGDYDVDGITSLTIFYEYIKEFPVNVSFYIPHRTEEGYGLNKAAIRGLGEKRTDLLICFDCGTNARDEIELAHSLGIDVVVVDHHTPKQSQNIPYAFINPKREDSQYPFKDLSTAAVAFKLIQALSGRSCFDLLDLVALSVVCDVVPVKGENRVLLREGLRCLRTSQRKGITALCDVARIKPDNIEPYHIGYILGPRINASGRVSSAKEALQLFISPHSEEIKEIAIRLDQYNRERRMIEQAILREAEEMIERSFCDQSVLVVYKEGWHLGVLGIVAAKLADKYWRPTFVIGLEDKCGRGSARSIPDLHIIDALEECKDLLATYGGHKKAAGIEISEDVIEKFKERFNMISAEKLKGKDLSPQLNIDMILAFKDITMDLVAQIEQLKPFGEGNAPPLFLTRGITAKTSPKRVNGNMYSFWVCDDICTYEAVFYSRDLLAIINYGEPLDIVYELRRDTYHNSIRLFIKDLRLS